MTDLPHPIVHALREPFTDASLAHLWPSIERRRVRDRWTSRLLIASGALAIASVAVVFSTRSNIANHTTVALAHGPLRVETGAMFEGAVTSGNSRVVTFTDRSHIALSPDTQIVAGNNSDTVFDTTLTTGRAQFDVTPHGPRRWTIQCGLATVTVVGTSFTLDRTSERLHVEVAHGRVLVKGDRVSGGSRMLTDGESMDVFATTPTSPVTPPVVNHVPARDTPRTTHAPLRVEMWRTLAASQNYQSAWDSLGPHGIEQHASNASPDDLLTLGEVAHRSRHYPEASRIYARFVGENPSHAQAGTVAFTLGRIQIEQLSNAREAVQWFARARTLGVARYLQEDLAARTVEALARSGQREQAREAAQTYVQQFPNGRRTVDVRRWAE
jgi:transmembrane sensor